LEYLRRLRGRERRDKLFDLLEPSHPYSTQRSPGLNPSPSTV
jgi:hypothetical protein